MKTAIAFAGLTLAACTCWATRHSSKAVEASLTRVDASADLGERAYAHVANLCSFGPRFTGSEGWKKSVDYIEDELRRLGLQVRRDTWTDPVERVEFNNVIATLPGAVADKIVLGCHHDTKCTSGHPLAEQNFRFVGANDSGSGVGLLLALAAELRTTRPHATIEFAFFDGEESIPYDWDITRALFGSRRYVDQYERRVAAAADDAAPVRAFVLLDMVGAKDLQIDQETESDPELRRIVARAAAACGHAAVFFQDELKVTDDHMPFLLAGIPAIDLIDIIDNPEWHTPHDTLDTISANSLRIVGEVVLTALPEIDRRFVPRGPDLVLPPVRADKAPNTPR